MRPFAAAAVLAFASALAACSPGAQEPADAAPGAAPDAAAEDAPLSGGRPILFGGVDMSQPINLLGTEPFWGVEIVGHGLRLGGVDRDELLAPNPGPVLQGDTAVIDTQAADGTPIKITLTAEACSDGMSDRRYPLTAEVQVGQELLEGCGVSSAALRAMPGG